MINIYLKNVPMSYKQTSMSCYWAFQRLKAFNEYSNDIKLSIKLLDPYKIIGE